MTTRYSAYVLSSFLFWITLKRGICKVIEDTVSVAGPILREKDFETLFENGWYPLKTISTLNFGIRAKSIKNKPVINVELSNTEYEEIINAEELKQKIRIGGVKIHTIGELKPHIKSLDDIKALEDYLEDLDYDYIYKWMQFKLMGRRY